MTKKRFLGVVIAVLLAAALLLGVWWLIARPAASGPALNPQESHDPYAGLSETAIPYAMRQSTSFSPGNPPAVPADYPAIQLKQRELSLSDFALEELGEEYTVSIEDNTLIIRRSDWEEQSTAPLEVSREQQYTKVLQDLTRWKILDPDEDFSVVARETNAVETLLPLTPDDPPATEEWVITERGFAFLSCYKGHELTFSKDYANAVLYDAQGLKYLQFRWCDVENASDSPSLQPMEDKVARHYISKMQANEWSFTDHDIRCTYVYLIDLDGATRRAKVYYGTDLSNMEFADAETGEEISIYPFDNVPGPTDTHLSSSSTIDTAATWTTVTASQE